MNNQDTCASPVSFLPPRIIGISGNKGHGKNLLASFIQVVDPAFSSLAFAAPLKDAVSKIFGINEEALHDPELKEVPFSAPVEMDLFLDRMTEILGIEVAPAQEIARSPRELMQKFGTEYVREASDGYWIRSVMRQIRRRSLDAIITDVRFSDEADAIRRAGGMVIRIVRDWAFPQDGHASENVDFFPDALFHVASGDHDRLRDVAYAVVAMVSGSRAFPNVYQVRQDGQGITGGTR